MSSARVCHTASSGGRAGFFFDPDLNEAPNVRRDLQVRQESFQSIEGKLLELSPRPSVQDGLENGTNSLGRTVHVHNAVSPVPGPDSHPPLHVLRIARHSRHAVDVVRVREASASAPQLRAFAECRWAGQGQPGIARVSYAPVRNASLARIFWCIAIVVGTPSTRNAPSAVIIFSIAASRDGAVTISFASNES